MKKIALTIILLDVIINFSQGYGYCEEYPPRALFLLDTKDSKEIKKTVKFIENNGGYVGVIDGIAGIILGRLPRENAPYLIGKHHIIGIYFEYIEPSSFAHYGEDVLRAIDVWNNFLKGEDILPTCTLLSPKDGEIIDELLILFSWQTQLPKANIQISKDLNFDNCLLDTIVVAKEYKFASCYLDKGEYYWRVRALNWEEKANSPWSIPSSFKITTTSTITLSSVVLRLPTDTSCISQKYQRIFCWENVVGALGYRVQVSKDKTFKKTIQDNIVIGTTTCAHSGGRYDFNTVYYWRVSAFNEKGRSLWSEVWEFYIKEPKFPPGGCNPVTRPGWHKRKQAILKKK